MTSRNENSYEYTEPYHHYVDFKGSTYRHMGFGVEYTLYMREILRLVNRLATPNSSVLDFGCGDGKLLYELESPGASRFRALRGVEASESGLAFARAYHHKRRTTFHAETREIIDRSVDLITSVEVLEHIPDADMQDVVLELARILRPGGHLVICVPSVGREVQVQHFRHYDIPLLVATLSPHFNVESAYYFYNDNIFVRVLRLLVENRFYILRGSRLRSTWMKIISYLGTIGTSKVNSAHVIAVFRR